MFKKTLIAVVLVCFMLFTAAYAAPNYVNIGDAGNTSGLITITRPDKQKDFTYDQGYYFSGIGRNGIKVTLYRYDPNINAYAKLYKDGVEQTFHVGASGFFWTILNLNYGDNYFLARAEDASGAYQNCPFLLTYQSSSLRGITVNFNDLPFSTWK